MSTKLYGLKNCDGCRKALKAIIAADMDVELIDVRDAPLTKSQLSTWCKTFGREQLVNRRSTTWRSLSDKEKTLSSDKAAIELLLQHPALMKRPVINQGKTLLLGFTATTLNELKKSS